MRQELADLAGWYWLAVKMEAREMYAALPSPWWAKVLVGMLLLVALAIPGQLDEIAILAILKYFHARKVRKARALIGATS